MTQKEPDSDSAGADGADSVSWWIPSGQRKWKWEASLDNAAPQWIVTDIPTDAYETSKTHISDDVVLSNIQIGGGMNYGGGTLYYQKRVTGWTGHSGTADWFGLARAKQGGGDLSPNGIGGHADTCSFGSETCTA